MCVTPNNAEFFLIPSLLKSHIILVLDRLQCVARVNCIVGLIFGSRRNMVNYLKKYYSLPRWLRSPAHSQNVTNSIRQVERKNIAFIIIII